MIQPILTLPAPDLAIRFPTCCPSKSIRYINYLLQCCEEPENLVQIRLLGPLRGRVEDAHGLRRLHQAVDPLGVEGGLKRKKYSKMFLRACGNVYACCVKTPTPIKE